MAQLRGFDRALAPDKRGGTFVLRGGELVDRRRQLLGTAEALPDRLWQARAGIIHNIVFKTQLSTSCPVSTGDAGIHPSRDQREVFRTHATRHQNHVEAVRLSILTAPKGIYVWQSQGCRQNGVWSVQHLVASGTLETRSSFSFCRAT